MAGYFIVHSGRCARSAAYAFKEFLLGNHSAATACRKIRDAISDSWHDYKTPPITSQRKDAMSLVNKGARLYNMKFYGEALRLFKAATECDPTYARAYMYLGNALYKLAKQPEALRAWERAISVDPTSKAASKARDKVDQIHSQNQQAIQDLHEGLTKK